MLNRPLFRLAELMREFTLCKYTIGADGVLYQPAAATTSPSVFFNRHTHTHTRRPAHRIRCNAYTTDGR